MMKSPEFFLDSYGYKKMDPKTKAMLIEQVDTCFDKFFNDYSCESLARKLLLIIADYDEKSLFDQELNAGLAEALKDYMRKVPKKITRIRKQMSLA